MAVPLFGGREGREPLAPAVYESVDMREAPPVPELRVPRTGRPFGRSVLGSALVHALVILALIWPWARAYHETAGQGPGPAGGGGGGGGPRVEYVALPAYQPSTAQQHAPAPAVPQQFVPPRPEVTTPPIQQPLALRDVEPLHVEPVVGAGDGTGGGSGSGTGSGGGQGAGQGTGRGNAVGPGTGGGGGDVYPPKSKFVLLPPMGAAVPRALRGKTIHVHFWVSATGSVDRFDIQPEIDDRGYRSRFLETVRSMRFDPGTRVADGMPVAAQTTIDVTF